MTLENIGTLKLILHLLKHADGNYGGLDYGVCKSNQQLRVPGSSKMGSKTSLLPEDGTALDMALIQKLLVSNKTEPAEVHHDRYCQYGDEITNMATLELKELRKSYGDTEVVHGVNLLIESGEFCVFVGPSGCGKSTMLRMIAGLEDITSGDVKIAGDLVSNVPAAQRGLAMVFQSYALYPHMSVKQNLSFGLENMRMAPLCHVAFRLRAPRRRGPSRARAQ